MSQVNKRIRIDAKTWQRLEICLVYRGLTFTGLWKSLIAEVLRDTARTPEMRADILADFRASLDEAGEKYIEPEYADLVQSVLKAHPPQD